MIAKRIFLFLLAFTSILWDCHAEVEREYPELLNIDFTKNLLKADREVKGRFRGILPKGWWPDFPGWNFCEVESREINEGMEHFLRLNVTKMDSQRVQFSRKIEPLSSGKTYRLTIHYRNRQDNAAQLLLRDTMPPYATLWSAPLPPTDNFVRKEFIFQIRPISQKATGVFFYLNSLGPLDLVSLTLSECSLEKLEEKKKEDVRRPSKNDMNFLRNSRLPMGIQSGWRFDRNDTPAAWLSKEPGPSGFHYLTIRKNTPDSRSALLESEPFQVPDPRGTYVFSFSYRGEGGCIVGGGKNRFSLPFSSKWKRQKISFSPADKNEKAYMFRFFTGKELSVDAFRISVSDDDAYRSAGECEISFSLPLDEVSESRIQFTDTSPQLRYLLTGNFEQAKMRITVVNLYGEHREWTIEPQSSSGIIDYMVFPKTPIGQFRVEAVMERDGKTISPVNEFIVTRLPKPKYWMQDAPDSPFGIHACANDLTLKILKAGGINHVRLHDAGADYTNWKSLEPEKGVWKFRDSELDIYRRNHFLLFMGLSTAPYWATVVGKKILEPEKLDWYTQYVYGYAYPEKLIDFKDYVKHMAGRYGKIAEFFVWNEPWAQKYLYFDLDQNGQFIPLSLKQKAEAYLALQKNAWEIAQEEDGKVKIAGFNTVDGPAGEAWTSAISSLGGEQYCNIVDFHYYIDRRVGYPNDAVDSVVTELKKHLSSFHGKIYMSEGQGASKSSGGEALGTYSGLYHYTIPWKNRDENHQLAEFQVRYLTSMLANGISRIFLYSAHTFEGLTRPVNFLALLQADGYAHPQLVAVSALALRVEDKKFVRWLKPVPGVHVALFSDGRESTAVLAPERSAANMRLACSLPGVKAADLYGNPLALPSDGRGRLWYLTVAVSPDRLANAISNSIK